MVYIIQRSIAGDGEKWVRSDSFPLVYTSEDAMKIVEDFPTLNYRTIPATRKPKPYRRHAAITPLELRGAIAMLESASSHILTRGDTDTFEAWTILIGARMVVTRQLETL
jgi:hypothetical protein